MMGEVLITPLQTEDLPLVLDLLDRNGLPREGLTEHLATTLVAQMDGRVVGNAGVEVYDGAALLRSVAVDAGLRGQGVGARLVASALALAQTWQAHEVYLLTETAAEYFAQRGFVPIERTVVHPQVAKSVEFTTACPVNAQAMRLIL